MRESRQIPILRPKLIAVSVAACFALSSAQLLANPTGPTVVSGSAAFATAGSTLTVTNSANAVINWQGFSIGINEITKFIQPSQLSAVLNRVVGNGGVNPQIQKSLIDGILSSNGHVYLLNPMGVVIGATARIDVAGFVASSLNLTDKDFQDGRLRFTDVPGAGDVVNHGIITTASGGRVFLVAPTVENTGIITSPQGDIVLAAGRNVELVSEGSPFVTVSLTASSEQALNVGSLIADAGRIGVYGALVRNSGVAEANGVMAGEGGQIRFVATKDLTIDAGSRISANGSAGGKVLLQAEGGTNLIAGSVEATGSSGRGGEVQALGVRVGLIGNGVIDASGETGGGSVMVGGDFQGANPNVQNAQRTFIGPDGVIRADARTTGDGGRVIVWADGDTRFYGKISARGGSQAGNGGFVETSGKHFLDYRGLVDLRAPKGQAGTLLLDPDDMTLTHSAYGGGDLNLACNGVLACPGSPPFTDTSYGGGPATLTDFTLNTQLGMGSVVVQTSSGSIFVDNSGVAIAPVGGPNAQTLTLNSYGNVSWSGNWSYTNNGALTLNANNGSIFGSGTLTAGTLILFSKNGIGVDGGISTQVSNLLATKFGPCCAGIEIDNIGDLTLLGVSNAGGGVTINTSGNMTVNGQVTATRKVGLAAYGNLTLNNIVSAGPGGDGSYFFADADLNGSGSITSGLPFGTTQVFTNGGDVFFAGVGVQVAGINTTSASNGSGSVFIQSTTGDIQTGSVTTRGIGPGQSGGDVGMVTQTGRIFVNGDIDTRGADGGGGVFYGGHGGDVMLFRNSLVTPPAGGIAVQVNGSIRTGGGNGVNGALGEAPGGYGGNVTIGANGGASPLLGSISVAGEINTAGGKAGSGGMAFYGGFQGGQGGQVTIKGSSVTTGLIDTRGGAGGDLNGGIGFYGGSANSSGGSGGAVFISAGGSVLTGPITTSGANAGNNISGFDDDWFASGGDGGSVKIDGSSITTGTIIARGANGGNNFGGSSNKSGGVGGKGGIVTLKAVGNVMVGPPAILSETLLVIDTSGGNGGAGAPAASPAGDGGKGGNAGDVTIEGNKIVINGFIDAIGGAGGPSGPGAPAGVGGDGGDGGKVFLNALLDEGSPAVFETPVNALPGTLAAITGIVFVNAIEKAPFDINRAVHVGGGLAGPGGTAGKPGMIDFGGNVTFITLIPPVSDTDATTEAIDKILNIIQFGSCKAS